MLHIMVSLPYYQQPVEVGFVPTRQAALEQLHAFLPMVLDYRRDRNYDRLQNPTVSRLSPYLRYRMITEEEVVKTVLSAYSYDQAEAFIDEVCWRTYFKGHLELHPAIWHQYAADVERLQSALPADFDAPLQRAMAGATGIDCFDAWAIQLRETGYLHNHARMSFASIWIFTLRLPWQLGAAFFMEFLTDADPASNILSWRWVGGLHSVGKHYLAKSTIIRRVTEGRFFPRDLVEDAEPLPYDGPFAMEPLARTQVLARGAAPDMSSCPAGLLVTPEDLSLENSPIGDSPFSSIALFTAEDVTDYAPYKSIGSEFLASALEDAATRLAKHWQGEIVHVEHRLQPSVAKAVASHVGCQDRKSVV